MIPYQTLLWLVVLGTAGYFLLPHSVPILLALVTAIILEPLVRLLQRTLRCKRPWAVTITFCGFLLVVGWLLYFLTTRMVIEVVELFEWLPSRMDQAFQSAQVWLTELQAYYEQLPSTYASSVQSALASTVDTLDSLAGNLIDLLISIIKSLPNLLVVSAVYVVALFLFSLDLPGLVRKFLRLFDEATQGKVKIVLNNLNQAIIGFLQAQVLISFLTYDLVLVGLWILGVKYALAVALIIVIVDILPILGTGAVILPWSLYAFATGNKSLGVGLLVLYAVIIVFRRIVEPKILGQSLGISALATLVSMYLGFMLLGVMGLLLGPALVILYQALREAGFIHIRIRL